MKSIQGHLAARLVVTTLALGAVAGAFLYLYVRWHFVAGFDAALSEKARAIGGLLTDTGGGQFEFNFAESDFPEFSAARRPDYFEVWRADGTVVARSRSLGASGDLAAAPGSSIGGVRDLVLPDGRPGRARRINFLPHLDADDPAAVRRAAASPPPRPVTVVVAADRGELDDVLRVLGFALLSTGLALSAGTVIAVAVNVRGGLRPLHALASRAESIDAESLHHRFDADRMPLELQPIARRLNELLSRIGDAFERERRFTADVAHELRTPISELRTLAEVALKFPDDPGAAGQNYRDTFDIAVQMESLVSSLLAIARSQAGLERARVGPMDLPTLLRDAWAPYEDSAAARKLVVTWNLPKAITIESDRVLLTSLFGNLFSNAATYTSVGGVFDCQLATRQEDVAVTFANDCVGLQQVDLPHVFEPFWRKDGARSGGVHCGLGLPLVAAYAAGIGATVRAELTTAGRFSITVTLPFRATPHYLPAASGALRAHETRSELFSPTALKNGSG